MEEDRRYNDVVKDIREFVECTQRCILPHNILLYNIIMNALEMMVIRSEQEGQEDTFSKVIIINNNENNYNCNGNCNNNFNMNNISETTKKEIDSIIDDVTKELSKELGE